MLSGSLLCKASHNLKVAAFVTERTSGTSARVVWRRVCHVLVLSAQLKSRPSDSMKCEVERFDESRATSTQNKSRITGRIWRKRDVARKIFLISFSRVYFSWQFLRDLTAFEHFLRCVHNENEDFYKVCEADRGQFLVAIRFTTWTAIFWWFPNRLILGTYQIYYI